MTRATASASPAVSILVTCHDLGAWLEEAVDSALAQTFDDLEIVIVDDGSTDPATVALLDRFARPRTRVVRTPRQGLARARNRAIAESRGRYLCALDADDVLHPQYLARLVPRLEADPTLAFVSTWQRAFGAESWLWTPERCDLEALLVDCTVGTAAVVRRDAVLAVGGYDEAMPAPGYEDWDLWISLVERGFRGEIVPELLFGYRRRPGAMSEICNHGEPHVALHRYLVGKHRDSYRRHLVPVLLARDREAAKLWSHADAVERRVASELEPLLRRREEDLARIARHEAELAARRASAAREDGRAAGPGSGGAPSGRAGVAHEAELARTRAALADARGEVAALRASWSWRLTAPLRALVRPLVRAREATARDVRERRP